MNMKQIAGNIGMPVGKWGGHCYQIVALFLAASVIEGEPATGCYHSVQHVTDHAWIKLADGRICDPTRYWLERKRPYIFVGNPDKCYEEKGLRWARELAENRRKFNSAHPDLRAVFDTLSAKGGIEYGSHLARRLLVYPDPGRWVVDCGIH